MQENWVEQELPMEEFHALSCLLRGEARPADAAVALGIEREDLAAEVVRYVLSPEYAGDLAKVMDALHLTSSDVIAAAQELDCAKNGALSLFRNRAKAVSESPQALQQSIAAAQPTRLRFVARYRSTILAYGLAATLLVGVLLISPVFNSADLVRAGREAGLTSTARIRLAPLSVDDFINRGRAWEAKKEYDKAIAEYTEAIRLDPQSAEAFRSLGNVWQAKKEYDKAIAFYDEAIRLDPKHAKAFKRRGNARGSKKRYDKAIADYHAAIQLDPTDAEAFINLGLAWQAKKEYDKAIADFDEAIRLDPKYALAFNNRGWTRYKKKEYDKAIADFDEAIRLDPKYAEAFLHRGRASVAKKEYDKAIADYTKAIQLLLDYTTTRRSPQFEYVIFPPE
jgi:tetratricopeptide (TPR) repeat protein